MAEMSEMPLIGSPLAESPSVKDELAKDEQFEDEDSFPKQEDGLMQSPTMANGTANLLSNRRPPRKSTLTQQQKNQKRQRATQDQLGTLEIEFNKNPTPTAAVREHIAQEINMTERSVQIWFQNRRAKIKNLAKKSIETGEGCDAIPESMRKYLAIQAIEQGKSFGTELYPEGDLGYQGNGLLMNSDAAASKIMIHHIACHSLNIGSWRRVGQTALDLVVFYSPLKAMVTYYINSDASGFRLEYPFSSIRNITLESGDPSSNADGSGQSSGGLIVELIRPPTFSMDPGSGGWFPCHDFTEGQQASQVLVHRLGGHPKVLSNQLAKLVSLDAFRNRHTPPEPSTPAIAMPVSPGIPRPASQPQHYVHPHLSPFPPGEMTMGPPPPRGHKRQRSRSVPVAVDFSQLRPPIPSFNIQHQDQHFHFHMPANQAPPHLFAPRPQHPHQIPQQTPTTTYPLIGPHLTADHSSGYGFPDFRFGPLSATTPNSPAEFDSAFYATQNPSDILSTQHVSTPYAGPFLSPMPDGAGFLPQSVSPLSAFSQHGDPIIANHSPPLAFDRSGSAEIFSVPQEEQSFTEDPFAFNDMYAKHPFSLPFRSPTLQNATPLPTATKLDDEFEEFADMVNFSAQEQPSLSPDNSGFSGSNH